eukprot:jgi/Orpsp1_1/1175000/evm.model.c7180000052273.1
MLYDIDKNEKKRVYVSKFDSKIKGDMMKQIILYDIKVLLKDTCDVLKSEFYYSAEKYGDYDMLIYDKKKQVYWVFKM